MSAPITPGPWIVTDHPIGGSGVYGAPPHPETTIPALVAHGLRAADARLIAAAPLMLETLEEVAKWCHGGHGHFPASGCGLCKPILAAIAKARGGA